VTVGIIDATGVSRRAMAGVLVRPVAVARSHVGAVRQRNEDRWLARAHVGLWAVADGMGGHAAGETASSLVVEALGRVGSCDSGHGLLTAVRDQIGAANAELRARAANMAHGAVIGATVVALLVFEDHCAVVWAGDSRAYRLRHGRLEAMTRDHRLVQELLDTGQISAQEAARHPMANVITRAVGVSESLDLETRYEPLEAGDRFVLASDGLTDVVSDDEIAGLLAGAALDTAADDLLALSLARGAGDNVTFILIEPKL
jgi:serine/threonine protein phosphatase PrpC